MDVLYGYISSAECTKNEKLDAKTIERAKIMPDVLAVGVDPKEGEYFTSAIKSSAKTGQTM